MIGFMELISSYLYEILCKVKVREVFDTTCFINLDDYRMMLGYLFV